ncbi:MAG: hypothetical protein GXP06_01555 [Alphaproteobacteria bacterium]|nr:hypothetical protein [Alphaproteobacteria bacterium]
MKSPNDEWQSLREAFSRFSQHLEKAKSININTNMLRSEASDVSQQYFQKARHVLQSADLEDEIKVLDEAFGIILELSDRSNAKSTYKRQTSIIRRLLPKVGTRIILNQSVTKNETNTTDEDKRVIQTLGRLVPAAALSYEQAIHDLSDSGRISFRGPALELREALREALDHLAPDEEVTKADGYVKEKDRHGPTMKQKVRFILKARGQSKSTSNVPEQASATVDEMVGNLTRSIYTSSSVATHVAAERKTVTQLRRYVVAILHDILEL